MIQPCRPPVEHPVPIAKARTRPIEGPSERFAFSGELQFGAFGEVPDEAAIQCIGGLIERKSATTEPVVWRESRMPGIGGCGRVSSFDRGGERSPANRTGVPASSNTSEPVGP